jgi:hypothetical protein
MKLLQIQKKVVLTSALDVGLFSFILARAAIKNSLLIVVAHVRADGKCLLTPIVLIVLTISQNIFRIVGSL